MPVYVNGGWATVGCPASYHRFGEAPVRSCCCVVSPPGSGPSPDGRGGTNDDPTAVLPRAGGQASGQTGGQQRRPRRQVVVNPAPVGQPEPQSRQRQAGNEPGGHHRSPPPPAPPSSRRSDFPPPGRRRRRGRSAAGRVGRGLAILVVVGVVAGVAAFAFGWWQFSRIERVDVGPVLSSASTGTNYLVVGSDSRAAIDPGAPDAGAFLDGPTAGERADTIIVLRVGDGPARMLSIPRDLWVTYPTTGEQGRINGAFVQGPGALVAAVSQIGIPIDHYMQIDFVSFAGLVDAVGGIELDFPNQAFDSMSGLAVETTGAVTLDGSQALAYVRSREYTEVIDGQPVTDPTGDIGRTERQRAFLTALFGKLGSTRNPLALRSAASALAPGMAIDNTMTYLDALGLVLRVRGISSQSQELPVYPFTTSGGAAVLGLSEPDAAEVLAGFN